jgi:hypothetical protein
VHTASEWRAKAREAARTEAVELELPSGAKILARRPDAVQMASWGKLPLQLAAAAGDGRQEGGDSPRVADLAVFCREILEYCCVSPRVNLNPQSDEIHPREIPQADWVFLVNWALRVEEARALESFRARGADDRAGSDGADVRGAAERAAGDRGPGAGAVGGPGGVLAGA